MYPSWIGKSATGTRRGGTVASFAASWAAAAWSRVAGATCSGGADCARNPCAPAPAHTNPASTKYPFNRMIFLRDRNSRSSALSPPQFVAQNFVVRLARRAYHLHFRRSLGDHHAILRLQLKSNLSVQRQIHRLSRSRKIQLH